MKLIRFSIPDELGAWEALESTEGVTIEGVYRFDSFVVVKYQIVPELLEKQLEELQYLQTWADNIQEDKFLPTLKNSTQRELYLLEKYSIDTYTAGRVWEYMKMQEKRKEV
jgi:hypothetical protein